MEVSSLSQYALLAFGSIFAVLNPFATVPPFLAMTESNTIPERRAMAERACLVAAGVLIVFGLTGVRILTFFGVTGPAFQIAGGLVLIRVAFELLTGGRALKVTPEERLEGIEKEDISVTPLGIPILCGPATITTGILLSSQAESMLHSGVLVLDALLVYGLTYGLLLVAVRYTAHLSEIALRIASRVMGLLLVAIAAQFMVDGLRESLPGLA